MKKCLKHRVFIFGVLLVVLVCLAVWAGFARSNEKANAGNEMTGTEPAAVEQTEEMKESENEAFSLETGEKTVYAKADANGNVKEITVETLMKDEEGEEFRHKEEYDGELPVSVKISYFLNGEQITAGKLAGKSGKVKIRFDYENISGEQENTEEAVLTPFTVISALVLPSDTFSNVEVENGELISMEGQNLLVGYALPGVADYLQLDNYEPTEELEIPEYVEITADVTEFELDFTATVITNGIFEDLEEEDLDDVEEMTDSMDELSDVSKELVDGTSELYDGMKEFHSYIIDFAEAIGTVSDGTGALEEGLKGLDDNKDALKDGIETLNAGLKTLDESLTAALQPQDETTDIENEGQQGAETDGESENVQLAESEIALMKMIEELEISGDQKEQLMGSIQLIITEKVTGAVTGALTDVQSGVKALHEGSEALVEGVDAFNEGVEQLYEGSIELHEGTEELFSASIDLNDGFVEVVDGVKELKEGFEEFDREGIKELEKLAGTELRTIVSRLRELKDADNNWNGFWDPSEERASVRMILETEEIGK